MIFDPNSYPRDLQLRIEKDIANGGLAVGRTLRIADTATEYSAAETDMRCILPAMIRKGLIRAEGRDSFTVLGLPQAKVESVFQFAQKAKLKPTTVVRNVNVITADEMLAAKLTVETGAALFQQVRTRLVDGKVLANQYNFIPWEICPGLEAVDLSRRSFQVTLEEDFHTIVMKAEETYGVGTPERDDASILDLQEGDQLLVVQRMSYSSSGMPLVFSDIHVSPSQFHYVENLWPEAADIVRNIQS